MKITLKQLNELKACEEGKTWFKNQKLKGLSAICKSLIKQNHVQWANWILSRLMTHPQKVLFSIFCAEKVLSIFENKYPNDDRPRKAIQAAKDFLAGKIDAYAAANADAANAAYAAADAAYAAAYAANADAANAAYAAANAAYAANADAAYAAYAAANAAYAAADAAKRKLEILILNYGLKLLGEIK